MILDLTISLLLKTRRIKLPWTNDELKSLKGIKEIGSNASSDAAKRSLMNAFTLTTAIDARILNIPNVMGHIANSDSRVRAAIQGQSAARTTDQPSLDAESTTTAAPHRVFIFTGDYIVRYLLHGDHLLRLRTFDPGRLVTSGP